MVLFQPTMPKASGLVISCFAGNLKLVLILKRILKKPMLLIITNLAQIMCIISTQISAILGKNASTSRRALSWLDWCDRLCDYIGLPWLSTEDLVADPACRDSSKRFNWNITLMTACIESRYLWLAVVGCLIPLAYSQTQRIVVIGTSGYKL